MQQQPHSRPSWASGDDTTAFFLIVLLVSCCAFSYLLWTSYHAVISAGVIALHRYEIAASRLVTDWFDGYDRQLAALDPGDLGLADLYAIGHAIGLSFRIPAAILILSLAGVCMARAAPSRFRRSFDLDGLFREQAASFPTTSAFVSRQLRLVKPTDVPGPATEAIGGGVTMRVSGSPAPRSATDHADPTAKRRPTANPDQPGVRPAEYALTPEEWVAHVAIDQETGLFDEAAARRALVAQLGPVWADLDRASPQARCMIAVCALHLAERRAEALTLLGVVSAGLSERQTDDPAGPPEALTLPSSVATVVDAVLADRAMVDPAVKVMERHGYIHTALMGLLVAARRKAGVLAPGQFAWLKLLDRGLWYALHSLGFETDDRGLYLHPNPRVEAVGARDHWAAERIAGGPLIEPDIARALDAVRLVPASRPKRTSDQG